MGVGGMASNEPAPDMVCFALRYATDRRWPVFPLHSARNGQCSCGDVDCGRAGKHPRTAHGLKDATTDAETIRAWWSHWPDANIGVATGAASGIIVLDVDGVAGGDSLLTLFEPHGFQLDDTLASESGGGGRHVFFQHPGAQVANSVGRLGKGLDIRGDGGYIVVSPSVHQTGQRYSWRDENAPISPLPAWLAEQLCRTSEGRLLRNEIAKPDFIPQGRRNSTLASLAGTMRHRGMDVNPITAALLEVNNSRCQPPLPEPEVRAIADSISQYPPTDASGALGAISVSQGDSQTLQLLQLGDDAELFHTPDGEGYARIKVNEHWETWRIADRGFRDCLTHRYFRATGKAPSSQAMQNGLALFRCRARFDGSEQPVFVRIAEHEDAIYIDLSNERWEAVEIAAQGWRIIEKPPVKFRRTRGMLPLPKPVSGGQVEELHRFLNVEDEADLKLVVGWLVATYRPRGPYPVLVLHGEHGSAKSTAGLVLRKLVDPNTAPLRSEPREPRDLVIAASNGWVVSLDNLSYLPPWLSDGLCRLATGGGFATRELYSDDEERIFQSQRPIMLNGISEIATRPDLLDRALIVYLPSIPEERRRAEADFWRDFELLQPRILGALLDAVVAAMNYLPHVQLPRKPRMADFALWATAAEGGLRWESGSFMRAYMSNRASANELALEASPLTVPLRALAESCGWEGTATQLLEELTKRAGNGVDKAGWPKNANVLSSQLRRLAPNLRAIGIDLQFGKSGNRFIKARKLAPTASETFEPRDSTSA
jgi:hypothetical protein